MRSTASTRRTYMPAPPRMLPDHVCASACKGNSCFPLEPPALASLRALPAPLFHRSISNAAVTH